MVGELRLNREGPIWKVLLGEVGRGEVFEELDMVYLWHV